MTDPNFCATRTFARADKDIRRCAPLGLQRAIWKDAEEHARVLGRGEPSIPALFAERVIERVRATLRERLSCTEWTKVERKRAVEWFAARGIVA